MPKLRSITAECYQRTTKHAGTKRALRRARRTRPVVKHRHYKQRVCKFILCRRSLQSRHLRPAGHRHYRHVVRGGGKVRGNASGGAAHAYVLTQVPVRRGNNILRDCYWERRILSAHRTIR